MLFNQSIPWMVEDLRYLDIWIFGMLAYADEQFRKLLQEYLGRFRSPLYTKSTKPLLDIFQTFFDVGVITVQVQKSSRMDRIAFLRALSYGGTCSMLIPFISAGVDVNDGNLLGFAVEGDNYDTCQVLLENGANTAPAISTLTREDYKHDDRDFKRFMALLFDSSPSPTGEVKQGETLKDILRSRRVRKLYPQALDALLSDQFIDDRLLYSSNDMCAGSSYMCLIIINDWSTAMDFFLDRGVPVDVQIGQLFRRQETNHRMLLDHEIRTFTWLTLAVELGRVDCVDILVKHGADIFLTDELGRTPLQLSRVHAVGKHPRGKRYLPWSFFENDYWEISASDDEHVLGILEEALAKLSLDEAATSARTRASILMEPTKAGFLISTRKALSWIHDRLMDIPQIRKVRRVVRGLWYELYWHAKLSFQQGLYVRLGYVLSYLVLVILESISFIFWLKSLPRPSKGALWAGVLLMIAVVWSLQTGLQGAF